MHFIVRQVRIARRCWPLGAPPAEATMVCPLCAVQNHSMEKTAAIARNGYIQCQRCDRFSAIFADDGAAVLPVNPDVNSMCRVAGAINEVRTVLSGNGDVLGMLALDPQPVDVSFKLDRIVLTRDATDGGDLSTEPAARRNPMAAVPLSALRVLARGNLRAGALS